jgi:hypothetical protein
MTLRALWFFVWSRVLALVGVLLVPALAMGGCASQESIRERSHGTCKEDSFLDSAFVRQHHYAHGRVWGIKLYRGKLVPPGEKGEPDRQEIVWMCRYHIAMWTGIDPVTKRKRTWQ